MSKQKSAHPHFYELGTGLDSPGKFSRRHILRCSKCDASVGFKPMNDQQIRRKAVILGWDIGKTQTQHLCPKHAHAQKSYVQPQSIVQVQDVSPVPPPQSIPVIEEFTNWFCKLSQATRTLLFEAVIKRIGEKEFMDSLPKSERSIIKIVEPTKLLPPVIANVSDAAASEPDPEDMEVADIIFGKRKSA